MGRRSQTAWLVRRPKGVGPRKRYDTYALVTDPQAPGRYLLTHPCVTTTGCPTCGALVDEPCRSRRRRTVTSPCPMRRAKAAETREPNEPPPA